MSVFVWSSSVFFGQVHIDDVIVGGDHLMRDLANRSPSLAKVVEESLFARKQVEETVNEGVQ